MLDLIVDRRPRPRHRHARPDHRQDRIAPRPTRWCWAPAATATSIYLSTNAKGCNATAIWRAYKTGALFANPCFTQIHPTCIPVTGEHQSKLTLMSESLRNDGRVWVPRRRATAARRPDSRSRARLLPGAPLSQLRQPGAARRRQSRNAKAVCDEGRGVGETGLGVYLDFRDAIERLGRHVSGSATATCSRCTSASPAKIPTRRPCASTRPSTTPWAACGWTTT